MKKIYSVEEIQKIEQKEFKRLKNSFILMKRAGINCAKKIHKINLKKNIIVLCGPGNNGGDGLVISRILKNLKHDVTLYCLKSESYKGDAIKAYKLNKIIKNDLKDFKIDNKSIIIDCLFGIGLNRDITGTYKTLIKKINSSKQKIISIDIPSGVNGDTGEIMGIAVKADRTFVLHAKKNGHVKNHGKKYSGKINVIDIGIKPGKNYFPLIHIKETFP